MSCPDDSSLPAGNLPHTKPVPVLRCVRIEAGVEPEASRSGNPEDAVAMETITTATPSRKGRDQKGGLERPLVGSAVYGDREMENKRGLCSGSSVSFLSTGRG